MSVVKRVSTAGQGRQAARAQLTKSHHFLVILWTLKGIFHG
ncbi:hypothetical protein ABIB83_004651 [Bradyrhizobium sp. I1.8.5]